MLITKVSFESFNASQTMATLISYVITSFSSPPSGIVLQSIPVYLVEQNVTYLFILFGVTLCILTCSIELLTESKLVRSKRSAAVLTTAIGLIFVYLYLFSWNYSSQCAPFLC
ncbi:hypothetical protein N475_20140 [Pseudoalteromonas luteoviolacea DSM 6061]|uniref:Uncharacterized protein n=1 Tax=Pseudoalteromonas luteoviolacea DSM 6061 TaxID=1365250 RepID=A0A166VTI8_9GAMM|nr:hypothetical protein N475_20140 [Pseudoalteromonas luteoviolacea DSM 6061]MBE0389600.1 hypothetical protein [Pseudoalteromonas luteoviolacea DSM 6061]